MARPRNFDIDEVLERAVRVFWQKGFANTSMQDLVEALGINRASMYNVFGDKEQLFLKSLHRYREANTQKINDLVETAPSGISIIRTLFESSVSQVTDDSSPCGCFIANVAAERGSLHPETREFLAANEVAILRTLETALHKAIDEGELSPKRDVKALAQMLFTFQNGLNLLGKYHQTPERMQLAVDEALSCLN